MKELLDREIDPLDLLEDTQADEAAQRRVVLRLVRRGVSPDDIAELRRQEASRLKKLQREAARALKKTTTVANIH